MWSVMENRNRVVPNAPQDLPGRLRARERRGLSRPRLHATDITRFHGSRSHGRSQAPLNWIGCRPRRAVGNRSAHVFGCQAPTSAPAEGPTDDGVFRQCFRERLRPCRMNAGLRCTKEACADLHGTGAQRKCRGNAPAVGNTSRGDDGDPHCIDHRWNQGSQSYHFLFGLTGIEAAAVSARFHTLNHNHVCTGSFRGPRFGDGRCIGKPGDAERLESSHEFRRVKPHHRRDYGWADLDQRLALRGEVGGRGVSRLRRNRRPPVRKKFPDHLFPSGRSLRGTLGDPEVDLESAVARGSHLIGPGNHVGRRHQERPAGAETTGVGNGNRESRRACTSHGRQKHRHAHIKSAAELTGTIANVHGATSERPYGIERTVSPAIFPFPSRRMRQSMTPRSNSTS